ncbi:hypothetical protein C2R22_03550 [Salinigranum rubrum]|uniref:Intracellular proteinase inhibitor BsuPI domain-containing protein n=1 Tax=Salinigranum rubrum TaxID=755307 RepID=A0A2I8VPL4_9EURY|nr:hypothetical protein [Salinigranum rubrum]AUV83863.1 hypothetical protein C2R22_03550 [Salinigranum rubrum]
MSLTRRTVLGLGSLALAGALAGCTGSAPRADGGDDSGSGGSSGGDGGDNGDGGLPGSDSGTGTDSSGAGGTRPEGTGGPGVTLVSVDDDPDLPVRPSVELVRDTATADHPPQLRTTLTNTTDSPVRVGEGRAVHFEYVYSGDDQLVLLPGGEEWPAEPDCWRLTEGIAVTEEYRMLDISPGEPSTRLVDLYATPGEGEDADACLPVGEHRFETTISVLSESGEQQESVTWGFTVLLE